MFIYAAVYITQNGYSALNFLCFISSPDGPLPLLCFDLTDPSACLRQAPPLSGAAISCSPETPGKLRRRRLLWSTRPGIPLSRASSASSHAACFNQPAPHPPAASLSRHPQLHISPEENIYILPYPAAKASIYTSRSQLHHYTWYNCPQLRQ